MVQCVCGPLRAGISAMGAFAAVMMALTRSSIVTFPRRHTFLSTLSCGTSATYVSVNVRLTGQTMMVITELTHGAKR
jgi:hypothetical protein